MPLKDLPAMLENPATREDAAIVFGDFVRDLCLAFGAELETAAYCGTFAAIGIKAEWDGKPKGWKGLYR